MSPYHQIRGKIEEDYREALRHIDWLENYDKRNSVPGQQVVEPAKRESQTMPPAPAAAEEDAFPKAARIDEAIAQARGDFSTIEVMAFLGQKYPSLNLGRKYVAFVLYTKEKSGDLKISRKGRAGSPNYYRRKDLSAVNGREKSAAT